MSVYLCVLLLIGCHSLQNALCLGQMQSSPEISISKQTSLNSAVSILLDSCVQLLPSFFPFLVSISLLLPLLFLTLLQPLSSPTWSYMWVFLLPRCPSFVFYFLPQAYHLNVMVPKVPREGFHFTLFLATPQFYNSSRSLWLMPTQSLL